MWMTKLAGFLDEVGLLLCPNIEREGERKREGTMGH